MYNEETQFEGLKRTFEEMFIAILVKENDSCLKVE